MKPLNRQMATGVAWMVLARLASRLIGVVSTLILVRLLMPEDFGLVAMAMSIIAVLEMLGYFSFDTMLIQKQDATRSDYDTAWTFNVVFGLSAAGLLVVLAQAAAVFYSEPRLVPILFVLGLRTAVAGFNNIGTVDFRKKLQFDREFTFMFMPRLAGFLVTVVLAWMLRDYWALVAGMLVSQLVSLCMSYWMHPYRPRFSLASRNELFGFSKWLFIINVFDLVWLRSADFIIGRVAGARAVGLFSIAYEISNLPTTEMSQPINRAVFPGYARLSADPAMLRQAYINVLTLIALAALPAGFGIAAISELLVSVALGEKWLAAGPLVAVLAVYGTTNALLTNTWTVFVALGNPRYLTYMAAARVVVLLVGLLLSVPSAGALGAAMVYLGVSLAFMPVIFGALFRLIQLRVNEFVRELWRPVIGTLLMYIAVRAFLVTAVPGEGILEPLSHLLAAVILGAIVYAGSIVLLWQLAGRPDGGERFILDRLKPIFHGLTRK